MIYLIFFYLFLSVDLFNKSDNEKPKSELEIMQEQRDSKRRRVAYRGKRVHTDRKSYIEVSFMYKGCFKISENLFVHT